MKVNSENAAGVSGSRQAAAARLSEIEDRRSGRTGGGAGDQDKADVSGLVVRIGAALEAQAAQREARVQALAKTFDVERHSVHSGDLSRKLVGQWLAAKAR